MNPTTESRLWLQIRANNLTAHHAMITGHLGIVYHLAREYKCGRSWDERQDLVSVGFEKLILATRAYAASFADSGGTRPGCRFSTFAHRRIEGGILKHIREDETILRPESAARAEEEADLRWESLSQEVGREPSGTLFRSRNRKEVELNLVRPRYVGMHDKTAEPGVEERGNVIARGWEKLPSSTKALVGWLSDSFEETCNVSLSQVAHYLGEDRQILEARLQEVKEVFSAPE